MTLAAAILLLGFSSLLNPGLIAQSTRPSTSQNPDAQEQTSQNPVQAGAQKSGQDQTSPSPPLAKPKPPVRKGTRRKRQVAPNCDQAPPSSTSNGATSAAGAGTQPQATPSEAPKNCPPAKIVVRQGGIAEQSIQLAGGSNDAATQKRDAANQMLAATEENLKKISGRQLSTDQQNSASQIRQFVNQSKKALASGDMERAQTLAWKAKLLSEDLVNPGK